MFDINNVKCTLNAEEAEVGCYGYFSNSLKELKRTLIEGKTNLRTLYSKLDYVLDEIYERRFLSECGSFSLFYPLEKEEKKWKKDITKY